MASADVIGGGNIEPRALEDEMRTAYLDYAMSVIVGRALPDVRDGLKPVHRRVLYALSELGLGPTRPYAKCAKIVGEVMGNYHPHGDSAIYDTLVRLGQDFSTGGIIVGQAGIREAYETGRGRVRVQARAHVEPLAQGKEAIVVTELPFMVKKNCEAGLAGKIKELVKEGRLPEIADMYDHTDKRGMRFVIELKRDAIPKVVLNKLYKHTPMQTTFGVNMVALVDNVPRTLDLRAMIHNYVAHQREVIVRRAKHELAEKEARAHILQGLLIALDNLDAIIELIRASRDRDAARRPRLDGHGHEGRRLHRAPLRVLLARLPAVLLQPRQGLPLQGLRTAGGFAHGQGPRPREHPAAARRRAHSGGALDAGLQRGQVSRLRDALGHCQ